MSPHGAREGGWPPTLAGTHARPARSAPASPRSCPRAQTAACGARSVAAESALAHARTRARTTRGAPASHPARGTPVRLWEVGTEWDAHCARRGPPPSGARETRRGLGRGVRPAAGVWCRVCGEVRAQGA